MSGLAGKIDIHPVQTGADFQDFLRLPYDIYRAEPNWIPPLRFEQAARLNPKKNPGLAGVDFQLFLAKNAERPIGRIAAILNHNHQSFHKDKAGHFGYFDAINDEAVKTALLNTAENWLKSKGADLCVGPYQVSIYEEVGLLVRGFDTPPCMMMPFGRADYAQTLINNGYVKAMDLIAYWADMRAGYPRPKIVQTMLDYIEADANISVRPMRKGHFLQEVQTAMEIFNDAWSDNWGHVPLTDAQIRHMASELKPLILPDLFWVCEYKGKAAAFILMVPNINEAISDLNGKLLPFGWAKMLWRLKVQGLKTARIPLMGVKREFQRKRSGLAMAAFLSEKVFEMGRKRGMTHVEMSWILENNKSMIRIIEQAKGIPYKTYRMYEKPIS